MNCESVSAQIAEIAARTLPQADLSACMNHISTCSECSDALRGAEALAALRAREIGTTPGQAFETVVRETTRVSLEHGMQRRFWLGAGFGGLIAASLFAAALSLGWLGNTSTNEPEIAEFLVALNEPRQMDIAIETNRPLEGATISIYLSGNVELDGFAGRREISWAEDLDAGVNRLSLPVIALDDDGGQIVVRLSHPLSSRVFVINLQTEV